MATMDPYKNPFGSTSTINQQQQQQNKLQSDQLRMSNQALGQQYGQQQLAQQGYNRQFGTGGGQQYGMGSQYNTGMGMSRDTGGALGIYRDQGGGYGGYGNGNGGMRDYGGGTMSRGGNTYGGQPYQSNQNPGYQIPTYAKGNQPFNSSWMNGAGGGQQPGTWNPQTGQFNGVTMSGTAPQNPNGKPPGTGTGGQNQPGNSGGGPGQNAGGNQPLPPRPGMHDNGNGTYQSDDGKVTYDANGNRLDSNGNIAQGGGGGGGGGGNQQGGGNGGLPRDADNGGLPRDSGMDNPGLYQPGGPMNPTSGEGGGPGGGGGGGWAPPPSGPGNSGPSYYVDQNGNLQMAPGNFGNMMSYGQFAGMTPEAAAGYQNYMAMQTSLQQQAQSAYENQRTADLGMQQFGMNFGLQAQGQQFEQGMQTDQWGEQKRLNQVAEGVDVRNFGENVKRADQQYGLQTQAAALADKIQSGQLNIQSLLANHTISNEDKQQALAEVTQRQNNANANRGMDIQTRGQDIQLQGQNQQFQLGTRAQNLADKIQTGTLNIQQMLASHTISNEDKQQALAEITQRQNNQNTNRSLDIQQQGQNQQFTLGKINAGISQQAQNLSDRIQTGQLNIQQLLANHTISNEDKQQVLAELTQRQNNAARMQELSQTGAFQTGQLNLGNLQATQQNAQFYANLQQEKALEQLRLAQQDRAANVAATGRAFRPNVNWLRAS